MRQLAWLSGAVLLLVVTLLVLALDSQPLVSRNETIAPQSIAQARWLLLNNDPRQLRSGEARQAAIPAPLIDEATNYLASRYLHGRGAFLLAEQQAEIRLTLNSPRLPGGRFLNITATLQQSAGEPHISAAKIGALPIPGALVDFALATSLRLAGYEEEWQLARQAVRELKFDSVSQRLIVSYIWKPALLERARSVAIDRDNLARMRSAQEMLAALLDHKAAGSRVELSAILGPMLDVHGSDQRENRKAAIFVLAAFLSEKNIVTLIPEAANWPRIRPVTLTLLERPDSAQHFVISATLAAWAGEPIANAIGLYKELDDAQYGSGFSFADLAADRAGTRFGELLAGNDARLQALSQGKLTDHDLAPRLSDLPEAIDAGQFRRQFGHTGSPAYQRLSREIERRISSLPLYQTK